MNVPVIGYLITSGRYVIAYDVGERNPLRLETITPGEYRIVTRGRLPRGTEAGEYRLELLATSQVLFEDGTVAAPVIEEQGRIVVTEEVTTGWDEGPRP